MIQMGSYNGKKICGGYAKGKRSYLDVEDDETGLCQDGECPISKIEVVKNGELDQYKDYKKVDFINGLSIVYSSGTESLPIVQFKAGEVVPCADLYSFARDQNMNQTSFE